MAYQPLQVIQYQIIFIHILNIYDLVWFYSVTMIVGFLMPNPFYTFTLNI